MNGLDFLEKINDIDDNLIDSAARKWSAPSAASRPNLRILIAAGAAVIAAAAILIVVLSSGGGRTPNGSSGIQVIASESTKESETETSSFKETSAAVETTTEKEIGEETTASSGTDDDSQFEYPYFPAEGDDEPEYEPEPDDEEDAQAPPEYRVISIESHAWNDEAEDLPSYEDNDLIAFWEDDEYTYYIQADILEAMIVIYDNGETEDLVTALENQHIFISNLDEYHVPYYSE